MPLIVRDVRTTAGFSQQGSVDWVALSRGTLGLTIQGISRLSQAGIEALTVLAARGIFLQVRLGAIGQGRIEKAVKSIQVFPSMNSALWFGFGVKHVVRNLSESAEGLACIGICSCLTEEFSASVSAQIIAELFRLYKPPDDLTPALGQWTALINACQGVVAVTEFGIILSSVAKIFLLDGTPNLVKASRPEAIAKVLQGLFEVSLGSKNTIVITGGADCAWFAAVAHWLLELSVQVVNGQGEVLYRPGYVKEASIESVQVTICYERTSINASAITKRSFVIPSGDKLIHRGLADTDIDELSIISHGRLQWSACLTDTFGSPMRSLLSFSAANTGLALGAAARIFEHLAFQGWHEGFPGGEHFAFAVTSHPVNSGSYGRGFLLKARSLLPELSQSSKLLNNLESMLEKSTRTAIRDFSESMSSIIKLCACRLCQQSCDSAGSSDELESDQSRRNSFCSFLLVMTICNLVRLSSNIEMPGDTLVYPTRSGIERIYWELKKETEDEFGYDDPPMDRLFRSWLNEPVLTQALRLYSGRSVDRKTSTALNACAIAAHGLCVYTSTLTEISIDPERILPVKVVPGRIQWKNHTYDDIQDPYSGYGRGIRGSPYAAKSATLVSKYDHLEGYVSPKLEADLRVGEMVDSRSVTASWHIRNLSTPGHFEIGPKYIAGQISRAHPAARCDKSSHRETSLDGFRTLLITGEGTVNSDHLNGSKGLPIVRFVGNEAMAIWVVLSDAGLYNWTYQDGEETVNMQLEYILQGQQCLHCCVMKTNRFMYTKGLGETPVCILTSP
jgi:hypothetical protein